MVACSKCGLRLPEKRESVEQTGRSGRRKYRGPESVARKDASDTEIENNKKKERKPVCVYENAKLVKISE